MMRILAIVALAAAAFALAACGPAGYATPQMTQIRPIDRVLSMMARNYVPHPTGYQPVASWMRPGIAGKNLLYISLAASANVVNVYDYPSGEQVGTLGKFNEPLGQCVDAQGDVYVVNVGNARVDEYAHGSTHRSRSLKADGYPDGCSVNKKGDLAVTSFETTTGPGSITVFDREGGKKVYKDPQDCYYLWPAGYDDKGDLVVEGRATPSSGATLCGILSGAKSMKRLTTRGIVIDFPDSVMWDGKYLALGDQEAKGTDETGIWRATLSGSTLSASRETLLHDNCDDQYNDVVQPFVVGAKNTPVNDKEGSAVVGGNQLCGSGAYGFWHYPAGGSPFKEFDYVSNGQSVSIAVTPR
jgi:hypothetical protein